MQIKFTVKTRLGFASTEEFDQLLPIFARHSLDALTVHARTVAQLYRLPVHYDLHPPGSRDDAVSGHRQRRRAFRGAGAGAARANRQSRPDDRRGVIRSPWLFNQIRQQLRGEPVTLPTGRDVWAYIRAFWDSQACLDKPEKVQCDRMKKFLNYPGRGRAGAVPAPDVRRSQTADEFHRICREFLDHDQPMAMLPAERRVLSRAPEEEDFRSRASPAAHRAASAC